MSGGQFFWLSASLAYSSVSVVGSIDASAMTDDSSSKIRPMLLQNII